jgi:hypothetical protein
MAGPGVIPIRCSKPCRRPHGDPVPPPVVETPSRSRRGQQGGLKPSSAHLSRGHEHMALDEPGRVAGLAEFDQRQTQLQGMMQELLTGRIRLV